MYCNQWHSIEQYVTVRWFHLHHSVKESRAIAHRQQILWFHWYISKQNQRCDSIVLKQVTVFMSAVQCIEGKVILSFGNKKLFSAHYPVIVSQTSKLQIIVRPDSQDSAQLNTSCTVCFWVPFTDTVFYVQVRRGRKVEWGYLCM